MYQPRANLPAYALGENLRFPLEAFAVSLATFSVALVLAYAAARYGISPSEFDMG